jgi:octaprenyl-diphosphate synthase
MEQVAKDAPHGTQHRLRLPEQLRMLYAPVGKQLERVERTLCDELHSNHPFVDRLASHGFRLGGKRLRPALVLLSAKTSGSLKPEHLQLAAAVEMIHTATLIHDDVLDEATLRRHLETVNARWDNEASVLLGDYLFARSLRMASALDDPFASRAIGQTAQTMCEGELRQIESRGNYDLSEDDYLEIISDKTASLTACCCRLGSHYAGAEPATCRRLSQFGRNLGMAFQIADDLLDVLGDEATAGKSLGTDLAKQKPTLPLIRLLSRADHADRCELLRLLSGSGNHHRRALRPWLDRSDAVAYTRTKARQYAQLAAEQLDQLPPGEPRDCLQGLSQFVVNRKH